MSIISSAFGKILQNDLILQNKPTNPQVGSTSGLTETSKLEPSRNLLLPNRARDLGQE